MTITNPDKIPEEFRTSVILEMQNPRMRQIPDRVTVDEAVVLQVAGRPYLLSIYEYEQEEIGFAEARIHWLNIGTHAPSSSKRVYRSLGIEYQGHSPHGGSALDLNLAIWGGGSGSNPCAEYDATYRLNSSSGRLIEGECVSFLLE